MAVTIKSIKKRLEHQHRLKLAGISQLELNYGEPVILWTRTRDGAETWEILDEWTANLVVSDLHNDAAVERAAVYHRIPENAPLDVARRWLRVLVSEVTLPPDVIAAA